jgi:hypothetical protein
LGSSVGSPWGHHRKDLPCESSSPSIVIDFVSVILWVQPDYGTIAHASLVYADAPELLVASTR